MINNGRGALSLTLSATFAYLYVAIAMATFAMWWAIVFGPSYYPSMQINDLAWLIGIINAGLCIVFIAIGWTSRDEILVAHPWSVTTGLALAFVATSTALYIWSSHFGQRTIKILDITLAQ